MKKILIVVMSEISRDNRVLRQIAALKDEYSVSTIGFGQAPDSVKEHIPIPVELPYLPLNLRALAPHLVGLYTKSSQEIAAIKFVATQIGRFGPDLTILNDATALPLAESITGPVLIDMHEYAPLESEEDWRFRLFLMKYYNWLCARYLQKASIVTTVSRSLAHEYSRKFGVKTAVVLNAREYCDLQVRKSTSRTLRLVHAGLASGARELHVTIEAVVNLPNISLDLYLVAAPHQKSVLNRLFRLVQKTSNVRILNPVPNKELPGVIRNYDLSVIFRPTRITNNKLSMPNKLFESIQARVGIITSPNCEVASFCKESGIGVSSDEYSSSSLSSLIQNISLEKVNELKLACDKVAKQINAESESTKFREVVRSLI